MAEEQIIRTFYDAVSAHDLDKALSCFTDDAQFKDISTGRVYRGKKEIRGMAETWLKAFSDMKLQPSTVFGSGESYCAELELTGTHDGAMSGPGGDVAATGKKVTVPSCDVLRLKGGKIHSLSCYLSLSQLLSQIGAMPLRKAA